MDRSERMKIGQQTVEYVAAGQYPAASGGVVEISEQVRACRDATRLFWPEDLIEIRQRALSQSTGSVQTVFELVNETTLQGIARQGAAGRGPVAALNFASAKNPGGGFLGGSQAQEESLARSSALYASLLMVPEFYNRHRELRTALYSDAMILSPDCPIIRDDDGQLLEQPHLATFITSPAPNAGAIQANQPRELPEVPAILLRRSGLVLAVAAAYGYRTIILGAWGCGVFRNHPQIVAEAFMSNLNGPWSNRFDRVVFSVYDASPGQEIYKAFETLVPQGDSRP